jgi:uncharacterized membrane protein
LFLFVSILTGLAFTLIGLMMSKFPIKNSNLISGYRTKFSMKNQTTWDEAQRYSSKKMIIFGLIAIGIALILYFVFPKNHELISIISTVIGLCSAFCTVIFTEIHLRKMFDKNGNKIEGDFM